MGMILALEEVGFFSLWVECDSAMVCVAFNNNVRMYGFKLEGGEWFKEGFRKLFSLE